MNCFILETINTKSPDEILKERFVDVGRIPHAFSSIKYVGTRTTVPPTDFTELKQAVRDGLANSSVRSSRSPVIIYKALTVIQFFSRQCMLMICIAFKQINPCSFLNPIHN